MNAEVLRGLPEQMAHLDGRAPQDVLAWAAERFAPRLAFATGFGAEGCVVLDLIARDRLPIDVFTLDTGLLFPETYALWRRLEQRHGLTIRAVRPATQDVQTLEAQGARPWQRDPEACCAARKLRPLGQVLAGLDAWISAIRRDQTADRAEARAVEWDARFGLIKINPLATWTHADVWEYVRTHDVPVNPLHERGYPSVGCWPCTTPVQPGEDPRAGRWRGHTKTECGLHRRAQPLPAAAAALTTPGGR